MRTLTKRERQVAELIGKDLLTVKEVAHRLNARAVNVHSTICRLALKLPANEGTTPLRQIIAHFRPLKAA